MPAPSHPLSRRLSYLLRHAPHEAGLSLELGGWVRVEALLRGLERLGVRVSRDELAELVAADDKGRFGFDSSGDRIRANQGHSVPVDLHLSPQTPPDTVYHGTVTRFLGAILQGGLRPMSRHHVHLSPDSETARRVGARRGRPVVLEVDAGRIGRAGQLFYRSENGVWLTDRVLPEYLSVLPG